MGSIPGGGLPPVSPNPPPNSSGSGTQSSSSVGSPDTFNSSLQLSAASLGSSSISLISIVKAIGDVREALREALNKSMITNSTLMSVFTLAAAREAALMLAEFEAVINTVKNWNDSIEAQGQQIVDTFPTLFSPRDSLNNLISNTQITDRNYIEAFSNQNINGNPNWINGHISIYKNPATFDTWAQTYFPASSGTPAQKLAASRQSGINYLNSGVIDFYNSWFSSQRPNLQNSLNNYNNTINNYNQMIIEENNRINTINQERLSYGMPILQGIQMTAYPSSNIDTYLTYDSALPRSLPHLSLPPNSTPINYLTVFPNSSNVFSLPNLTGPLVTDQQPPRASLTEAFLYILNPFLQNIMTYISSINRTADLFKAQTDRESEVFKGKRVDVTVSNAYTSQQTSSSSSGSGVGLSSFAMGLHTKNLQVALANSIFKTVALDQSKPISSRLFAQLEFSAIQLLQNSSLISAIPAMKSIASALGYMAASTASISVPISLAILEQVGALIGNEGLRSIVNLMLNQIPQYARLRSAAAEALVLQAERGLKEAINSGDAGKINGAINLLTNARVIASRVQELQQLFGSSSIGDIANLTNATSAAMALSLLSVGMALLGTSIGILDLPAQLLGNVGGAPVSEILGFLAVGTSLTDALDNPLGILALKENLVNILNRKGYGNAENLVNMAIGQVIAKGGVQGLSDMKTALFEAFSNVLNPVQAHGLANQAANILFGNLGFPYSNVVFGVNYPIAQILPTLAHNSGIADTNAQALLKEVGTNFQTQGQFRDALYQSLQNSGVAPSQAMYFANGVATFALTGSIPSVYDISANYLNAIQKSTEGKLSEQLGISQADAGKIYEQAKASVLQQGMLNTVDQFHVLMMEELNRVTNGVVASQIYKSALAEAELSHVLVKEEVLKDKVRNNVVDILQPEMGIRIAEEIAHKIIIALFGIGSLNEASKDEKRDPLSALSRAEKALKDLKKDLEDKSLRDANEKIAEMIAVWVKPNAELGFLLQSLMDSPSTFIGSLVGPQKPKGEFLDIPV